MRLITVAKPSDLDLAVPPLTDGRSSVTLAQIMQGYSRFQPTWVRAANVEYRAGPNGQAIGVLAERGTVHWRTQMNWPVFWVDSRGRAAIAPNAHRVDLQEARVAFSVAPVLIRDAQTTNVTQEIVRTDGLDESIRPGQPLPRAAIGIRQSDGAVIHIADTAASLDEMATTLRLLGCTEAAALDGGGSMGVVGRQGDILIGQTVRQVCSALVFRAVLDSRLEDPSAVPDVAPKPPQTAPGGSVCLDPGHGGRDRSNRGPTGYVEADGVLYIALTAGQVLRSHGVRVIYTRTDDKDLAGTSYSQAADLRGRCDVANRAGVDLFVSIHTNADGGRGTETFYYPGSTKGRALAGAIQTAVVMELGTLSRRVDEANFHVLRGTRMPAALVEVAFHDNREEERQLLRPEFRARAGYGIAKGILDYFR